MYNENLRERLAALAHEHWTSWMEYLFANSFHDQDGTVIIPKWAVERWERQMNTPYSELSEKEKDSDRIEADKILEILKNRKVG